MCLGSFIFANISFFILHKKNNINKIVQTYAPIAQPVEQQPFKLMVTGSNPVGRTSPLTPTLSCLDTPKL